MNIEFLAESFKQSTIIKKGEYNYFIHPFTDGALPIDPHFLKEVCIELIKKIRNDVSEYPLDEWLPDIMLAPEAMGLPIAAIIGELSGTPWVVIRKRKYDLPGEIEIQQTTGYSKNAMYINSVNPGQNVIIVDDVVSTGGTLKAIINALREHNVNIIGTYVIAEKDSATERLKSEGYDVKALINIDMGPNGINNVTISR